MLKSAHHRVQKFPPVIFFLARFFPAALILAASGQRSIAAEADGTVISFTSTPAAHSGYILDTRSAAVCEKASLSNARCLPASDLFGPHKRLANFSGVLWLFGTAGLNGNEHVLVIGDQTIAKQAVAGLLYLAGQRKISILTQSVNTLSDEILSPGIARGKTREDVYQATTRADHIILRSDLSHLLKSDNPPVVLDGRGEAEYWGKTIRAQRGGHIPGAEHAPVSAPAGDKPAQDISSKSRPAAHTTSPAAASVAYAHNTYEGLAYLARLAGSGHSARLYLEGWVGWASNGALSVDNVTYPERRVARARATNTAAIKPATQFPWPRYAALGIGGLALSLGGFFIGRSTHKMSG